MTLFIDRFLGFQAYGQSKLANILHAIELARRLQVLARHCQMVMFGSIEQFIEYAHPWPIFLFQEEGVNVTVNAVHPGTMDTGLGKQDAITKYALGILKCLD